MRFEQITDIIISDRVKVNYFIIPHYKKVSIIRTSHRAWFIPYDYYANGHLIRANLAQVKKFIEGKAFEVTLTEKVYLNTKYAVLRTQNSTLYRRSIFYVSYTYFFILLLGFILYKGLENEFDTTIGIFGGILLLLLYGISGIRTHYFLLAEQYLVVKSLLFPWRYYSFKISDILDLEIEDLPKGGISLKLTARDYIIRRFICESLNTIVRRV